MGFASGNPGSVGHLEVVGEALLHIRCERGIALRTRLEVHAPDAEIRLERGFGDAALSRSLDWGLDASLKATDISPLHFADSNPHQAMSTP